MASIYTLKVVHDFASAHTLRDYPGACSRMHGHNWKVELEVGSKTLDNTGMAVDFKTLRKTLKEITNRLDHYYLNDIPPFNKINPTAENIARYLFQETAQCLNNELIQVTAITLWETERACVRYTESSS